MKGRTVTLAAIVVLTVLALGSPFSAAGEAGKTAMRIEAEGHHREGIREISGKGSGTFTLIGASTADSDSGRLTFTYAYGNIGKTADGQSFQPVRRTETLKGKRGTLVIRLTGRHFQVKPGTDPTVVETGMWSIVSGTGRYAGLEGRGGMVGIILPSRRGIGAEDDRLWVNEGYVTRS